MIHKENFTVDLNENGVLEELQTGNLSKRFFDDSNCGEISVLSSLSGNISFKNAERVFSRLFQNAFHRNFNITDTNGVADDE